MKRIIRKIFSDDLDDHFIPIVHQNGSKETNHAKNLRMKNVTWRLSKVLLDIAFQKGYGFINLKRWI